jgi:hypothetical protein
MGETSCEKVGVAARSRWGRQKSAATSFMFRLYLCESALDGWVATGFDFVAEFNAEGEVDDLLFEAVLDPIAVDRPFAEGGLDVALGEPALVEV